jgi:hypothetical protein
MFRRWGSRQASRTKSLVVGAIRTGTDRSSVGAIASTPGSRQRIGRALRSLTHVTRGNQARPPYVGPWLMKDHSDGLDGGVSLIALKHRRLDNRSPHRSGSARSIHAASRCITRGFRLQAEVTCAVALVLPPEGGSHEIWQRWRPGKLIRWELEVGSRRLTDSSCPSFPNLLPLC